VRIDITPETTPCVNISAFRVLSDHTTRSIYTMVKEDRSDWVAVAPEFAASGDSEPKINPAVSAFTFFQRDASEQVKAEYMATHEKFQVGEFSKLVRERWNELDGEKKEYYEDLGRRDRMRFASESHAADVAAIERRERLRKERATLLLDDEGGTQRSTRRQHAKKERKRERKEQKKGTSRLKNADDENFVDEEDDESSGSYEGESDSDSEDSSRPKKNKAAPRQPSQKQIEIRDKKQREKLEKEVIISERQDDLRKEKAEQAKRRLEFLLKQSNIFSHFGQVKEDQAKYGISNTAKLSDGKVLSRRETVDDGKQDDDDLEEADTHQATFLTSQPTTLAFGQMRQYQLEGLNWMIRLQENGVNGILADEVSFSAVNSASLRVHYRL
jgi:SWI/SNF-related matrix-associated actin-dependent regulator of chromatin subfamily A member 5